MTALFAIGFASIAQADKRVALIVGNGDYRGAALGNPTFDADLVAASLQSIGFVVKVVKNADLGTFDRAVTAFAEDAQGAEVALFYFAGHGFTVNEGVRPVSLLMSTSADVTSSSDRVLRSGGIALDEIVSALAGKAQATLVFVDACRNDPRVSRSVGSQARGFAPLEPVQGGSVFIGLSTRLGSVARDGAAGMGSPFARAFAVHIQTKGIRIDDAFRQLRDAVKSETEGDQVPDIVQDDLPNGAITLVGTPRERLLPAFPPTRPAARACRRRDGGRQARRSRAGLGDPPRLERRRRPDAVQRAVRRDLLREIGGSSPEANPGEGAPAGLRRQPRNAAEGERSEPPRRRVRPSRGFAFRRTPPCRNCRRRFESDRCRAGRSGLPSRHRRQPERSAPGVSTGQGARSRRRG